MEFSLGQVNTAVTLAELNLPPDVVAAAQEAQTVASSTQPAFDFIDAVASGQSVTAMQAVGAVACIAAVANPAAGALIGVIGTAAVELVGSVVDAFCTLGMCPKTQPTWDYVGFLRLALDEFPSSFRGDGWIDVTTFDAVENILFNGYSVNSEQRPRFSPKYLYNDLPAAPTSQYAEMDFTPALLACALLGCMTDPAAQQAAVQKFWNDHDNVVNSIDDPETKGIVFAFSDIPKPGLSTTTPNAFELFFNQLLAADLLLWANAFPCLPPRDLLAGAVNVWNAKLLGKTPTASAAQVLPYDVDYFPDRQPVAAAKNVLPVSFGNTPIMMILRPGGNALAQFDWQTVGQTAYPGTTAAVYVGPSLVTPTTKVLHLKGLPAATATAKKTSTGTYVAASSAVVGVAAAGAWLALGRPVLSAFPGELWSAITGGAARAWTSVRTAVGETRSTGRPRLMACERCPDPMTLQALRFSRRRYTPRQARAWMRAHGIAPPGRADVRGNYVRMRVRDPRRFRFMRTVRYGKGIHAVFGCPA